MNKIIIVLTLISFNLNAQGLTSRTGIDTGTDTGRSILRLTSENSIERATTQIMNRLQITRQGSSVLSTVALDLNNVHEVVLKDGTVYEIKDIKELIKNRGKRHLLNK
jgi:hypothetical protein